MARPRKKIDPKAVESLAAINCTVEEIASVMDCDKRTLERRFAASIKRGRENGRSSLRRMMYEKAKEGNVTMMIWLSKNMLGYADKIDERATVKSEETQIVQIQWADEGTDVDNSLKDASPDAAADKNQ